MGAWSVFFFGHYLILTRTGPTGGGRDFFIFYSRHLSWDIACRFMGVGRFFYPNHLMLGCRGLRGGWVPIYFIFLHRVSLSCSWAHTIHELDKEKNYPPYPGSTTAQTDTM